MDTLGQIQPFAGNFAPVPTGVANGSTQSVNVYPDLFQLIGNSFGGNGGNGQFNLPTVAPVPTTTTPLQQVITLLGAWPQNGMLGLIGEVRLWPNPGLIPQGWRVCDGSLLPINPNQATYAVLGTTFGGNGISSFGLPNLPSPSPGLVYIIAITGIFPPMGEPTDYPPVDYLLGSVTMFAGGWTPAGFSLLTNSVTLPINLYLALYSLLGTTYGGDGSRTFRLPQIAPLGGVNFIMPMMGIFPERP